MKRAILARMTRVILALVASSMGLVGVSAFSPLGVDPGNTPGLPPAAEPLVAPCRPGLPSEVEPILLNIIMPARPAPKQAPLPARREWKAPRWAVRGILAVETRSKLREDDTVRYVDKRRGKSGERGPTQLKREAFEQVKEPGECYWRVEVDPPFALEITERYLLWLYKQTRSWSSAIKAYNAGLGGRGCGQAQDYYERVAALGKG